MAEIGTPSFDEHGRIWRPTACAAAGTCAAPALLAELQDRVTLVEGSVALARQ